MCSSVQLHICPCAGARTYPLLAAKRLRVSAGRGSRQACLDYWTKTVNYSFLLQSCYSVNGSLFFDNKIPITHSLASWMYAYGHNTES